MTIRLYQKEDREKWNRYVQKSENSTCYHLIEWKDVIEKTFGHKSFYLIAEDHNKNITGILPLVQQKSTLFGNFMVSLPFFNYGGVCADSNDVCKNLIDYAIDVASDNDAEHIELRHTNHADYGLLVKTAKVSMRMELPQSEEILWNTLTSKLRSQIRRPSKEKMYARIDGINELESFYKVFSINMRDLGTPVYSKKFFKTILELFPKQSNICTIYTKEGVPVASGFLLRFKEQLEIPWASSIRRYNKYSPNMLLYWEVLKYACMQGCRIFDFGRSTPGEGTYKFKKQWGAKPLQLYWYYWMRNNGDMPELNPKNIKYQMAIRIWKKMPLGLSKIIGPTIIKNLP